MKDEEKPKTIEVERCYVPSKGHLKAAHKFVYTRVGANIQLDVGYFDAREIHDYDQGRGEPPALYITDSFVLSTMGAIELIGLAQEIATDLEEQGFIVRKDPEEEIGGEQ